MRSDNKKGVTERGIANMSWRAGNEDAVTGAMLCMWLCARTSDCRCAQSAIAAGNSVKALRPSILNGRKRAQL